MPGTITLALKKKLLLTLLPPEIVRHIFSFHTEITYTIYPSGNDDGGFYWTWLGSFTSGQSWCRGTQLSHVNPQIMICDEIYNYRYTTIQELIDDFENTSTKLYHDGSFFEFIEINTLEQAKQIRNKIIEYYGDLFSNSRLFNACSEENIKALHQKYPHSDCFLVVTEQSNNHSPYIIIHNKSDFINELKQVRDIGTRIGIRFEWI